MSKQDEYRQFAADALDMAGKAAGIDSKTRLLNMADAWLNLADRADREPKRPRHPSREHPLVTKVSGASWNSPPQLAAIQNDCPISLCACPKKAPQNTRGAL